MVVAALAAAAQEHGARPLAARDLLLTLAVIVVVCAGVVLAGLGYFSPESDDEVPRDVPPGPAGEPSAELPVTGSSHAARQ